MFLVHNFISLARPLNHFIHSYPFLLHCVIAVGVANNCIILVGTLDYSHKVGIIAEKCVQNSNL